MPDDMRLSRRALLAAGAVAALGALGACGRTGSASSGDSPSDELVTGLPGSPPSGEARPFSSVVIIGDSITAGSSEALMAALTGAGIADVRIDAQVSRRIAVGGGPGEPRSGMQALRSLLDEGARPDAWVVALGTNDIGAYREEQYAALVTEMLDALPPDRPVLWIDVYRRDLAQKTAGFNEVLRTVVGGRGGSVASWYAVCTSAGSDVLRDDQLHPNEEGTQAFAAVVAEGLASLRS